jgi:hypothetical protein
MKYSFFFSLIFLTLLLSVSVFSQKKHEEIQDSTAILIQQLRFEIRQLRAMLDSERFTDSVSAQLLEDDLEGLEERLEQRLRDLENKVDAISRSTAPTILNPRTTAFINFAARIDNTPVYDFADPTKEISNRPFLRTFELDLRNPVDPYAEAVTILSAENEAGGEFALDVEEAYGLIKRLPLIESAPLGLKLKIGKFRAPLGVNNKIHMHDLPWTTRPLVISSFLGTEHGNFFESGYNPTGVDLDFFLPNPIAHTTLEMNIGIVRSGEVGFSQGYVGKQPAYVAHLTWSRDWNNEHLLLLGGSVYDEHGDYSTRLWGGDITYKWSPVEKRESHSFVAGGEIFYGKQSYLDSSLLRIENSSYGWFGYAQYQFSYWTYAGIRYDWLQEPTDKTLVTKALSAYLSYYTTEFLRFRIGFEQRMSDIPSQDKLTSGYLDVNFVFGSHPTEPYWVNR